MSIVASCITNGSTLFSAAISHAVARARAASSGGNST
jgi:hypothetical protein